MTADDIGHLLEQFRISRREFTRRLMETPAALRGQPPEPGAWSTRDLLAHVAAWIDEANDRIPRLIAGASSTGYDVDAFNAAAVARAANWSWEQALGAFRRAADRFEAIIAETEPDDILASEDALEWLRSIASVVMTEHLGVIDRLVARGHLVADPAIEQAAERRGPSRHDHGTG